MTFSLACEKLRNFKQEEVGAVGVRGSGAGAVCRRRVGLRRSAGRGAFERNTI